MTAEAKRRWTNVDLLKACLADLDDQLTRAPDEHATRGLRIVRDSVVQQLRAYGENV